MPRSLTLAFALLAALPAYGETIKCLKPDGTEESCASRQLDLFPAADAFGPIIESFLRAEYGGRIDQHIARWKALAASDDNVEIRDLCASACTLVTAYIPKQRLCFSPTALLAFHHARSLNGEIAMDASQMMFNSYPQDIRMWLQNKGGLEKMPVDGYWYMLPSELWQMGYRRCEKLGSPRQYHFLGKIKP
jgi:hypothetical protein